MTTTEKTNSKANGKAISVQKKIGQMKASMCAQFLEREDEVTGLLVAALAREHICLLGIAGTGKSAITRAFAQLLSGATYWETCVNRFTVPEQLVGPIKMSALKRDDYERNTLHTLLDCDVAFVDEVFKCNAASLQVLLPVMNERQYDNGSAGMMKLPLRILVGASNEMPESEELNALWDRYLLRYDVKPLAHEDNRLELLMRAAAGSSTQPLQALLNNDEWDRACTEVAAVTMGEAVGRVLLDLRRALEREGIEYGDRRWVKVVRILQAHAYVCGDAQVDEDHLDILANVLWRTPDDRPVVAGIVAKASSPQVAASRQMADAALNQARDISASGDADDIYKGMSVLKNAGHKAKRYMDETRDGSRSRARCSAIVDELRAEFARMKTLIDQLYAGAFGAESEGQ